MTKDDAINLIIDELERATLAWPEWPTDPVHAAAVLAEEAGEVVQAALEFVYQDGDREPMGIEATQVGAMAIRFLMSFGKYDPTQAPNHIQL